MTLPKSEITHHISPSPPLNRISPPRATPPPQQRNKKKCDNPRPNGYEQSGKPSVVVNHEQRISPSRRMNCSGYNHEHHCQHDSESRIPESVTEHLETKDPNECTPEMAAEQCTRLCRVGFGQCKQEYS